MSAQPDGLTLLASPVRRLVVETLATQGPMTAAMLGDVLDLHVTTARFHVDQLVAAGLVESRFERQRSRVGRPRKVYAVAPGSFDHPHSRDAEAMRTLTALLADALSRAGDGEPVTPEEAGRRWAHDHVPSDENGPADSAGRWLAKVGAMVDVLSGWGYTPEVATTNHGRTARVTLAHCPFLDLAKDNPAVVCGIHRGLVQGALEQLGEDEAEVGLEPFVGPHTCLAHVTTRAPFRSDEGARP